MMKVAAVALNSNVQLMLGGSLCCYYQPSSSYLNTLELAVHDARQAELKRGLYSLPLRVY